MIAGLAGVFKDSAEASGQGFQSPILGRPDFEKMETQALKIDNLAGHLQKLRAGVLAWGCIVSTGFQRPKL